MKGCTCQSSLPLLPWCCRPNLPPCSPCPACEQAWRAWRPSTSPTRAPTLLSTPTCDDAQARRPASPCYASQPLCGTAAPPLAAPCTTLPLYHLPPIPRSLCTTLPLYHPPPVPPSLAARVGGSGVGGSPTPQPTLFFSVNVTATVTPLHRRLKIYTALVAYHRVPTIALPSPHADTLTHTPR